MFDLVSPSVCIGIGVPALMHLLCLIINTSISILPDSTSSTQSCYELGARLCIVCDFVVSGVFGWCFLNVVVSVVVVVAVVVVVVVAVVVAAVVAVAVAVVVAVAIICCSFYLEPFSPLHVSTHLSVACCCFCLICVVRSICSHSVCRLSLTDLLSVPPNCNGLGLY